MSISTHPTEHRDSSSQPEAKTRVTTFRNGLGGGIIAVLLSFLPLSTVFGGGVAGYLDRGAGHRGAAAGVIAGLIAFFPYLLVSLYLAMSPAVSLPGPALGISPVVVIAGVTSFALVYTVGLSVLGSLLGGYLYGEKQR